MADLPVADLSPVSDYTSGLMAAKRPHNYPGSGETPNGHFKDGASKAAAGAATGTLAADVGKMAEVAV